MNNRESVLFIFLVFLFGSTLLAGCSSGNTNSTSEENEKNGIITLSSDQDMNIVYSLDYQNNIQQNLQSIRSDTKYTFNHPFLAANPYGTNTTGPYVYFNTDTLVKISYSISAEGYHDFKRELYGDYSTEHEYLLIGIIPDTVNTITLTATDQDGNIVGTKEIQYTAPPLLGSQDNIRLDVTAGESSSELSDGLYAMLGNRTEEDNEQVDFILLYDNYGTLRSEIPIKSYRACNILFDNDLMYYSISANEIAAMNNLGQIQAIYDMNEYQLHHDYIFGSKNDLLVLASEENTHTEEDRIISVNLNDGTVTEVIDLSELLENYFRTLDYDKEDEPLDWIHINSIRLVDNDSIIISSRETSTIIKIDNIYESPSIDYMIGSERFWEESGYDNLLLDQSGSFSLQAGQHCVEYEKNENLQTGQYYLYFYNNNNAVCSTRDYNYSDDEAYSDTYSGSDGQESYYYKYLVDENNRTFELVSRIPVTYSGYVSSVQQLENNLLIDSGSAFTAVELDDNNQIIQTLVGTGDTWWYRVFKFDFLGFWFD